MGLGVRLAQCGCPEDPGDTSDRVGGLREPNGLHRKECDLSRRVTV